MDPISSTPATTGLQSALAQSSQADAAVQDRALTRAVAEAARTLNESGIAGEGREVTFSLDQATRRPVVKVVDTSTHEVVQQWPPEYALQLAADSRKQTRDSG